MKNIDSSSHVQGKSIYVDDIPVREGTLYGAVFSSSVASGIIKRLDLSKAEKLNGIIRIFTAKDIPGENQIGNIIKDEVLMAYDKISFQGQPIAFIVAKTQKAARIAAKMIKIDVDKLPVLTNPREAAKQNSLLLPAKTFNFGNIDSSWKKCVHIFKGTVDSSGQEHLYLEPQAAYVYPKENGGLKVLATTQSPAIVQCVISRVLNIPMNRIEVHVTRLGGGFGGKEHQADAWATLPALASYLLKKPVKLLLKRSEDIRMTGKRHPYESDFKIGLDDKLKIIAFKADYYQNAGAASDLSPAITDRTLFHATASYFVQNVQVTVHSCKTNLPPNTAFRGFGAPQGMFVIESAIAKASEALNIEATTIQKTNLLKEGDIFPYGQTAKNCEAHNCWNDAEKTFDLKKLKTETDEFNSSNILYKKGLSIIPLCFGISFTKTDLNQSSALVHVYTDGSVSISTGAIEMGQGVNTKFVQIVAKIFSISKSKIRIESTNTTTIANSPPTAASSAADLNGKALEKACIAILNRLKKVAAKRFSSKNITNIKLINEYIFVDDEKTNLDWTTLINESFSDMVSLSEHAHYATPKINFDTTILKGSPFAYHVYGTAITIATVDCLRGTYEVDAVKIVHDYGRSMNEIIDRGQTEGALVQGIGWVTSEEIIYDEKGTLMTNSLSTYKIPDIYSVPKKIEIKPLDSKGVDKAIFRSKAIGEPPFVYGIGSYFSILNAIKSFNHKATYKFSIPFTTEKVLLALYS